MASSSDAHHVALPALLFVRALRNSYILFRADVERGYWKLNVVENPARTLLGGQWSSDSAATSYQANDYNHISENGHIVNTMKRLGKTIVVPGIGAIPEYSMTRMCVIVGKFASHVMTDNDPRCTWHFETTDIAPVAPSVPVAHPLAHPVAHPAAPVAPAPSAPLAPSVPLAPITILPHILHGFISYCISQGQECPITMEPLSLETIGMTPCGHLFQASALQDAIRMSGTCPTCRSICSLESITRCR